MAAARVVLSDDISYLIFDKKGKHTRYIKNLLYGGGGSFIRLIWN